MKVTYLHCRVYLLGKISYFCQVFIKPALRADAKNLVGWYLSCYNRLDKIRPKVGLKTEDPSNVLEAGSIGTVMHDMLYTLEKTLQNMGLADRETNPTLKRPHYKGGKSAFSEFENFEKNVYFGLVTLRKKFNCSNF